MIKAVLFDCDGLMFNTEAYAHGIWTRIASEHGVKLPEDFFMIITGAGRSTSDAFIHSIPGMDEILPEIRRQRFSDEVFQAMEKDSLTKPGLEELCAWLKEKGIRTAVCSSSGTHYVHTLLSTMTNPPSFDAVAGGDLVKKAKPDPEIFLLGASLLNTDPSECMVLEDSKQGIIAASRAGMRSCFIPDTIEPDDQMKELIDLQCESLHDVIGILEEMI